MTDAGDRTAASAQPLLRPPVISTGESRSATPLELFFDLAYVLVIAELVAPLLDDLTWHGAGRFAGLFVLMWLSWVGFTLYANRFDTDDAAFRGAKLLATFAVAGCAASATEATGVHTTQFAACYLLLRVVLVGLYLRAFVHVRDGRAAVVVYLVATGGTALLWAVSLLVAAPARYVLWAVAAVVDVAGPIAATALRRSLPLHLEHLPERFGLLVILVLGEFVGAVATGIHDQRWAARSVVLAAVCFTAAGALWWSYFDVGADVSARRLQEADDEQQEAAARDEDEDELGGGDERHDLFIYGHLPLTLGVAAAGAGLEHLILQPEEALPSAAGWLACGGVALFFAGTLMITGGAQRRWRGVLLWAVPPAAGALLLAAAGPSVGLLLPVLAAICVAFAAAGMVLTRRTTNDAVR